MQTNRRDFRRIAIELDVSEEIAGARTKVRAVELGELGMRYRKPADAPFAKDRQVKLEFHLPGDRRRVRVRGWVASEKVEGNDRYTSVTFAYLDDADAARLCHFVAARA